MGRRRSESRSASPDDRRRNINIKSRSPKNGNSRREGSPHLSKFYRERFGNQSPDDYMNLRISNFDHKISSDDVKDFLENEFAKYNPYEIKVVRHNGDDDRFAYTNFEDRGSAKEIRRTKIPVLMKKLGNRVCVDPTGVLRDQEGKYIPDRYNRSQMDRNERSPPERSGNRSHRDSYREERSSRRRSPPPRRGRERSRSPVYNLNKDVPARSLFVGNLYGDTKEEDLKDVFSTFGEIEDVEIKYNYANEASYSFVVFLSISAAEEAQKKLNDKPIRRSGDKKFKIGFAKAQISRRLWVGDLGSWTTKDMLEKEFDRFGPIEDVDYREGDKYAYITYNDVNAATDACKRMNGASLDRSHKISVDFAKVLKNTTRKRQHSSSSPDDSKRRRGPRTPSSDGSRSSSPEEIRPKSANGSITNGQQDKISTIEDLKEFYAATWKGPINLKKVDYVINLHRIAGKESILQDFLRDDDGRVLKLMINQRIPLDNSLFDKISAMDTSELAVAIGVEHDKSLSGLISYLKEKDAAGVITMPNVMTYIMVYSSMTSRLINHFAPKISVFRQGCNCVLVVVKKIS